MGVLHPDQRTNNSTAAGGVGYGAHPGVAAGTHIPTTQTTATGPAPNTAGPHRHDILNKLDPSVDSDMSKVTNAANAGTAVHTTHGVNANTNHHNRHGVSPAIAAGVGAGLGGGAAHHHNNHNNNGVAHTHGTHATAPSTAYNNGGLGAVGASGVGHHNHNNHAVPVTVGSAATGPAHHTGGPHQSDMVNRLDPTVDSHTGLRK